MLVKLLKMQDFHDFTLCINAMHSTCLEPALNTIPQFALNHPRYFLERGFAAQSRQYADLLER